MRGCNYLPALIKTDFFSLKIRCLVLYFCFFIFPFTIIAQTKQIDSLNKVLTGLKDSARIDCLNALSFAYNWLTLDSARLLAERALQEAETIHFTRGKATAYNNLAWINWLLADDFPEMEKNCNRAIALLEKTHSKEALAQSYFLLGCAYWAQAQFSSSVDAYEKAGRFYTLVGDTLNLAKMYAFMAGIEEERGHYGKSLEYAEKWLAIAKKYNNERYFDIWATLYRNIGDYTTAMDYYRRAAQFAQGTHNIDERVFFTRSIGEIYFLQEKYDSARHYYEVAINYAPNEKLYSNLGELYAGLKKYDTALIYLNRALINSKKSNHWNGVMRDLLRLSTVYKETGNNEKGFQSARRLLQIAGQTGARQHIRDAHFFLYQLFVQTAKQDSAFSHLQKYIVIKDTIDKELSAQKLAFYKIRSEKEKDQSRIDFLNEEKKLQQQQLSQAEQQKRFLFTAVAALCLIGLALFRNLDLKRKNDKLRLEHELELQTLESEKAKIELQQQATELEMQALRAQMNPHFIFNSLNSINRFILQNNKALASEYLTKFSRLVRLILQNSQSALIPLESELESLELYLQLEAVRFDHGFGYKIIVEDDLDISMIKVPPLIIQPYVENAIWHGLMHREETGHLEVELFQDGDLLCCKITDDGIGRKKATEFKSKSSSAHKSMGLRITADRIALQQQNMQLNNYISIKDLVFPNGNAAGTEVLLKLPIQYD